jgi:DNA-binding NarL/FixJ family response regulator
MPRLDGLGVLRALRQIPGAPPCLVLTTFDDRALALEAIREGARGYLRKDVTLAELVAAVETLAAGGTHLQPALTRAIFEGARALPRTPEPPLAEPLTPRETEVLRLMAAAYTNREIAEALGTAEGTVKIHVSNVLSKLGARDRTQAVLRSLEMRIL